jgi:very-short-patch-repair endonuclease
MSRRVRAVSLAHSRARRLRRDQTDAEKRLWDRLRSRELAEFRFRRQFPIGNFIADFACPQSRIAIELDGGHHFDQVAKDEWRTGLIEKRGFRVMRFWDNEVLEDVNAVAEKIIEALLENPELKREA